jgi:hypothetical protein
MGDSLRWPSMSSCAGYCAHGSVLLVLVLVLA